MSKVLIIAAHPDDELLGCGGTIINHVRVGDEVMCVFLADGVSSRYINPCNSSECSADVNERRQVAEQVAVILGMLEPVFCNFADQMLDVLPVLKLNKTVEKIVSDFMPDIVYTHFGNDLNTDHCTVHQSTMVALRPLPAQKCHAIYSFEIPSSTEWGNERYSPNVFVDISDSIDLKLEAVKLYDAEIKAYPHPRSVEAIEARAKYWGSICGKKYAEAFELVRFIR